MLRTVRVFCIDATIVLNSFFKGMLHGRNMDWNLPNEMRDLTFTGVFKKGGEVIYRGSCFIGFVGILTGFSVSPKGSYGISIDERLLGGCKSFSVFFGKFFGSIFDSKLPL